MRMAAQKPDLLNYLALNLMTPQGLRLYWSISPKRSIFKISRTFAALLCKLAQ